MSLLQPVAAILLSVASVLILRAVWAWEAKPERRSRKIRKPAYDETLRRAA